MVVVDLIPHDCTLENGKFYVIDISSQYIHTYVYFLQLLWHYPELRPRHHAQWPKSGHLEERCVSMG